MSLWTDWTINFFKSWCNCTCWYSEFVDNDNPLILDLCELNLLLAQASLDVPCCEVIDCVSVLAEDEYPGAVDDDILGEELNLLNSLMCPRFKIYEQEMRTRHNSPLDISNNPKILTPLNQQPSFITGCLILCHPRNPNPKNPFLGINNYQPIINFIID